MSELQKVFQFIHRQLIHPDKKRFNIIILSTLKRAFDSRS